MISCIIIEDQLPAQRILEKYIEDLGTLKLIGTFSNAIMAMDILKSEKVDLIFLDIHLPKLSGIDFLKMVPKHPQVILTTAFPDYALESYDLDVVDYLLKPFSFQRFVKAVSKVQKKGIESQNSTITRGIKQQPEIFIKSGYEHIKINVDDILFINSDSDYSVINLSNKKYFSSEPLKYWENKLGAYDFIRVHKSYIINMTKVEKVIGQQVYLSHNIKIPIGRTYKSIFSERFNR